MTDDINRQGHRKRLRERFIESGLVGFADYEIVELLLTLGSHGGIASSRRRKR